MDKNTDNELIGKYQWAGRIRLISFLLLLLVSWIIKFSSGDSLLHISFSLIVFAGAVLNQPYGFILRRVNLYRLQFYQMITDIVVISGILYYMGGVQAPIISIAYYAVILWAGVVSGTAQVFFAVVMSAISFSTVVLLEYYGVLPSVSYLNNEMPIVQMYSLLLGNVSFLFAFGYFSAQSSSIIKFLERKRQGESLKSTHKILSTGYIVNSIAHDIVNHQVGIRGYSKLIIDWVVRMMIKTALT